MHWSGLIEEYKTYLPVGDDTPRLTLYEGGTPLIRLDTLSQKFEANLYAKVEGHNPTGSFKDRGMVMAVAKAKEAGAHTVICASTGNTSASAAAYASRAGLKTIVVVPEGKIALGKLAQAMMYGAEIISIQGNFDEALKVVRKIAEKNDGITLVNSVNPYRLEGQKTAAFEIAEVLGAAPDYLTIPVGNAGNISAYWKGFKEYDAKNDSGLPKIYGFEAEGAAAIVNDRVIEQPETVATAIRIGNPASWSLAVEARDESGGLIESVTDEEILKAYEMLAAAEGIFAEPGSNASTAGMIRALEEGKIEKGATVVTVLTGNGLKDPETAMEQIIKKPKLLPNDEGQIIDYIEGLGKNDASV
ncbi:threonine synthase [Salinicoccus sp. CNSTN-B1]